MSTDLYARDLDVIDDYLSMVIYGPFGDGKTYLAGSAVFVPDYQDVLYISLEGGEKSLKQLIIDGKANGIDVAKHMLVIPVPTYSTFAKTYKFLEYHMQFRDSNNIVMLRRLEAQIRGFSAAQCEDDDFLASAIEVPKKIRTVIIDSLTEAQKYCMYQLLGIDAMKQALDIEPDSAEWAHWGKSREMIQFLVRRMRNLPINSFFICAEDVEQDARKYNYYALSLPGKLSKDITGMVDCVGYYRAVPQDTGIKRNLYLVGGTYGTSVLTAKHRFGSKLKNNFLENPTMRDIYNLDQG